MMQQVSSFSVDLILNKYGKQSMAWIGCMLVTILLLPSITMAKTPVLLVHGLYGSASTSWGGADGLKQFLLKTGWTENEILAVNINVDNGTICSPNHRPIIEDAIETLSMRNGGARIAAIGHSRGALNNFEVLHASDPAISSRIIQFIGLAGAINARCSERLFTRQPDPTPGDTEYITVCSPDDMNAGCGHPYIEGAENISLPGLSHKDLKKDPEVFSIILDKLESIDDFTPEEPVVEEPQEEETGSWFDNWRDRDTTTRWWQR